MKMILILVAAALLASACATTPNPIPKSDTLLANTSPKKVYIWVGKGDAYRYDKGNWVREQSGDYDFSVVQRRYENNWVSVKNQIRRHPDYDMLGGPRRQTHLFEINYSDHEKKRPFTLKSTYGAGNGVSDSEYRNAVMEFHDENTSSYAPFSHYRITQNYRYEDKKLVETVLLYKKDGSSEIPFFKIEESAILYD